MATADIELCNLALGRIGHGASRPVQSISPPEASEESRACALVYPGALDLIIRKCRPHITRRCAALALSTETVEGWTYAYAYPDSCAFLEAVSIAGLDGTRLPARRYRATYRLIAADSGESLLIATNLSDAVAWYSKKINNPGILDTLVREALSWKIAVDLALVLKTDPKMAQFATDQFNQSLSAAMATMANEEVDDAQPDADNITIRGSQSYIESEYYR